MNFFERYDRLVLTLLAKYGHPDFFDAGFFSSITLEFLYKEKKKTKDINNEEFDPGSG